MPSQAATYKKGEIAFRIGPDPATTTLVRTMREALQKREATSRDPAIFFFVRKKGVKYVPGIRVITRLPGTYLTDQFFLRREIFKGPGFFKKKSGSPGPAKNFAAGNDPGFSFSIGKNTGPVWKNPAPGFPTSLRFIPIPDPALINPPKQVHTMTMTAATTATRNVTQAMQKIPLSIHIAGILLLIAVTVWCGPVTSAFL